MNWNMKWMVKMNPEMMWKTVKCQDSFSGDSGAKRLRCVDGLGWFPTFLEMCSFQDSFSSFTSSSTFILHFVFHFIFRTQNPRDKKYPPALKKRLHFTAMDARSGKSQLRRGGAIAAVCLARGSLPYYSTASASCRGHHAPVLRRASLSKPRVLGRLQNSLKKHGLNIMN